MHIMFQIVEVNVEEVMTYFEKEMRKGDKSKHKTKDQMNYEDDEESVSDLIEKVHRHKHKTRHKGKKLIVESVNEEDIEIANPDKSLVRPPDIPREIPHQLTIKLHNNTAGTETTKNISDLGLKTVSAVIEHHDTTPTIEISAHHKHGHVRQH